MKNIFTKTLTLIAFLSLSAGVWGADNIPASITFDWSSKNDNGTYLNSDFSTACCKKAANDGYFYYSHACEDEVKNNAGFSDGNPHISTSKQNVLFRTKNQYHFEKGAYEITITAYGRDGSSMSTPEIYIGDTKYTSKDKTSVNPNWGQTSVVTYQITVPSAGDYYFRGNFANDAKENVGWGEITFAKAGPVAMKRIYMPKTTFNDWTAASAKFAVYSITTSTWQDHYMTSGTGCLADYYYDDIPETCEKVIIGRFDPNSGTPITWDGSNNPWNQTEDIELKSNNCITPRYYNVNEPNKGKAHCDLSTFAPPTYTVTYAAGAHGSGTMTDSNSPYACGSDVTVLENAFTAARGYVFNNFSDGSNTYDAGDVISDLQANKTLTAQWKALTSYTITASANPSHKGHVTGADTYYEGETVTLTAVSEDDSKYMFTGWSDGDKSNPRVFTAQSGITTNYVANFISGKKECGKTYTMECEDNFVNVEIINSGNARNTPSKFQATNASGYGDFSGTGYVWFGGDGEGDAYFPLTIAEDDNISFSTVYCEANGNSWINIYQETNETGDIKYDNVRYKKIAWHQLKPNGGGEWDWKSSFTKSNTYNQSLTAGKYIIGISNGDSGKGRFDKIDFTATKDIFCTIIPAAKCTISYAMNGHGTQIGDVLIEEGETWTAPTDPTADGWVFDGWKRPNSTGDVKLYKSGDAGFTVSDNETLTAQWSEDLSTAYFMKGTFVDDYLTQYDFVKKTGESTGNIAYLTIDNLSAGTDYWFMVYRSSPEGHWGQTGTTGKMTADNNTWTLDGGNNVGMTTTAAGSYTFRIDFKNANPQLHIEYPAAYTITFAKGNPSATGTMNNMVNIAENEKVTLTANNYALGCNHFVKWKDQDDNEYEDGAQVTVTKDLTLTAQWAVNRYKAIYDANGVTGYTGELPATVEYNCGDQVTVSQTPKLSKFGYTFIGWNTDPNATVALADNYQFTIDQGDTKIYAIWNVKKPTGLSIAPETGTYQVTKGTGVQMIVTLTPDASELAEENREVTWSTSNSTFATVNQSGYVNFVGQGSVTITATSKLDGSVSNTYNFEVGAGSCVGWEISAFDEGGKNTTMDYFYQVGSTDEWRVKYVLPNGTRKFWVGPCTGWSDHSKNWDFGWIRLKDRRDKGCDNNTQYAGQDAVGELVIWSNSTAENYGIAFLPNYKISYMTDDSNWRIMDFHSTSTQYSYETDIFQVPEGYKTDGNMKYFVGVEKNTGENMMVEEISSQDAMNGVNGLSSADMAGKFGKWQIYSNSCDRNWYCQFTRYYQVRFEMNGGDGNIDPMYFVGDNLQSFNTNTLTNPTRTGYELTGWKDQDNTTYATSQSITVTKDLVLTAQWTAKDYAITLDKNNGSTDGSASAKYDSNTLNSISHVSNRTGYTLSGYFTLAENGSKVITAEGALVASAPDYTDENRNWKKASNCTLYAQWTANKYNVNFDFDGGTGGKTSIEVTYDAAMPSAAPLPTREFYNFAGYFTAKNGEGTKYYNADGTSAHIWDITTDNTTLYAYWTPKSYAITWEFAGGHATDENYTKGDVPYGSTITAPTVEKTGYNFAGWNPAVGTMPGAPATYTAQWTAKTYTLTLDANGGSADGSVKVTYDSNTTTEFSAPTRDNYILEGFYAENGCTTKVMNADGSLIANVSGYTDNSGHWVKDEACTLYTKWTEKPKVDALIVTGDVNNATHNNGSAGFTYTHPNDALFGHKVLKIEYSNMSGNYGNSIISIDNGYQSSSSTGATGFGLWYKTDAGVTSIAFCFDYNNGSDQKKTQLPGTNGAWKYVYVASSHANGWSGSNIIIWMNGQDNGAANGEWTPSSLPHSGETTYTNPSSGTLYISEIRATEITEKFINHTVTFTQPERGTTSAQIKDGDAITSGDEVPEGTEVIFTWNEVSGFDFVKFNDGTTDYTQNPCTLTVNSNLTITTKVEVEVTKHLLTVIAGENGSVSPTSQEVGETREVTITATPNSHYGFASWTATGITLTDAQQKQNPLTITMPTNDVTLTASFEYVYVDNMIATGNNSSTPTSHGDATMSAESVVDANKFFNHNVLQFTYSGMSGSGDYKGVEITRDANYQQSSSVGATGFGFYYKTAAGQTITFCFDYGDGNNQKKTELPSTNGFWKYAYVKGSAANGWNNTNVIIYVNGTGGGAGEWTPSSMNVSSATTTPNAGTFYIAEICATERTTKPEETPVYTATFVANPSDKATVSATVDDAPITSGATVDAGKSITFDYSNLEANYRFDGWTATGISLTDEQKQQHPLTLKMPSASITLTANFVRVYTLTINNDGHGSATVSPNQTEFAEGEKFTLTAQPTAGYAFDYYMDGENKIETDPYEFTMSNSNRTISVHFKENIQYYNIQTNAGEKGVITFKVNGVATGDVSNVLEGSSVEMTVTIKDEYQTTTGFVQWQDGNTDNPRTIIANAANAAITWTPQYANLHLVEVSYGKPGREVTGGGYYATGAEVTLEAFVLDTEYDLDYNFSHWEIVSGSAPITGKEYDNPLTFNMSNDVSIKATFAPVECVDTFVIQCETEANYIPYNKQGIDLTTYPYEIPHVNGCGPFSDYYTKYHGTGYYDFKTATNSEMYYPVDLPASTYKFEMWSAANDDKNCWMNLYIESDDADPDVVYKGVNYKKTKNVKANNYGPGSWPFAISGTIENVVISSPKSVIIGLYCGSNYGAFDQIKITATDESKPFCHELPTDLFVINSNETKEIPVCGVDNLVIYDGGQANNVENVDVKTSIKHIRQVKQLDVWEDFALPFTATSIQVEDPEDHNMYPIYPAIRQYDGDKKEWIVKPGYFYMQELKHEEMDTVIGQAFRQRWEHSQNLYPQVNTPYIIEFIREQSGGYFDQTFITYDKTGSAEVIGYDNATVDNGSWPQDGTKPTFHYVANNAVVPVVPYDAYVLSEDHTMFELKEQPTIMPFHCYIQASEETKAKAPRLMLSGGGGTPTTLVPIYTDAEHQNYKVMIDEVIYVVREGKIYTVMGQLVK